MKTAYPTKKGFVLSITSINRKQYEENYGYALWEAGFNCAIRKMKKINNKKGYYSQDFDTTCFPIALCNCAIFLKKRINYNNIIKTAKCNHGSTINPDRVIKASGLPLVQTSDIEDVFKFGGIITIMHPIFNLHTCFIEPALNDKVKMINSWLGVNEIIINTSILLDYLPKNEINKNMYHIK